MVAWSEAGTVRVMGGQGCVAKRVDAGEEGSAGSEGCREGVWRVSEVGQETAEAGPWKGSDSS